MSVATLVSARFRLQQHASSLVADPSRNCTPCLPALVRPAGPDLRPRPAPHPVRSVRPRRARHRSRPAGLGRQQPRRGRLPVLRARPEQVRRFPPRRCCGAPAHAHRGRGLAGHPALTSPLGPFCVLPVSLGRYDRSRILAEGSAALKGRDRGVAEALLAALPKGEGGEPAFELYACRLHKMVLRRAAERCPCALAADSPPARAGHGTAFAVRLSP